MTPEEAISHCEERAKICDECGKEHKELTEWLKELMRYRAIGTVEECRDAVEKQKPKIPVKDKYPKQDPRVDNSGWRLGGEKWS